MLLNDHLFGKELFIQFTVRVFRNHLYFSCVYHSFPFGFEGRMCDLVVLNPDHCHLFIES